MHDPASALLNERWIGLLFVRCAHPQVSVLFASRGARSAGGSEPVNTSHHLGMAEDAHPSRGRLTLNEQLCFFGAANEACPPETSVGSWAMLALAVVIVPWTLIGLTIWMLS